MPRRFLAVTLFHSIFSTSSDIDAGFMGLLSVPLQQMFNESIQLHYGFVPTEGQLATAQSFVAASFFIGFLVGALLVGRFMDSMGRKTMGIYFRGLVGISSSLCIIMSLLFTSIELFALSNFLAGMGGTLKSALSIYVNESAPNESRGTVCMMLSSGVALMQLVIQPLYLPQVFGNTQRWYIISLIAILLCLIHMSVSSLFPPSPKHLYLKKHDKEKAKESLRFYRGRGVDVGEVLNEYENERSLVDSEHLSLREIWRHTEAKLPFIIVCFCTLVPTFSAVAIKGLFAQQILVDLNISQSASNLYILLMTYVTIPFSLFSPFLIEKIGRRPLFLTLTLMSCVEWACLGLGRSISGTFLGAPIGLFGMVVGNLAAMFGLLNLHTIIMNEIVPFPAKAKTTEFVAFNSIIFNLLVVFLYPLMVKSIGSFYHMGMLILSLSMFFLLYRLLPETRMVHVDSVVRKLVEKEKRRGTLLSNYGAIGYGAIGYGTIGCGTIGVVDKERGFSVVEK